MDFTTSLWLIIAVVVGSGLTWLVDEWILAPRRPAPDGGQDSASHGTQDSSSIAQYAGFVFVIACALLFLLLKRSPEYSESVELHPIVVFVAILSSVILIVDLALFAPQRAALQAARTGASPRVEPTVVSYAGVICPATVWMLLLNYFGAEAQLLWSNLGILAFGLVSLYDDWLVHPRRLVANPMAGKPVMVRIVDALLLGSALSAVWALFTTEAVDFSFVLAVLALVSGLIWAFDRLLMSRARSALAPGKEALPEPVWVEYARTFFPIIVIVLAVRSFVFEPFRIPSDSMMPTLQAGDFIFVNKYAYGLRLPVINSKVTEGTVPERGDVIVFRLPTNPRINYIKRLVGLPGDHIRVVDNQVYIGGQLQPQQLAGTYAGPKDDEGQYHEAPLGREQLGTVLHPVMFANNRPSTDFDGEVPKGYYFFMGDNRNNSQDSRFADAVGFVPEQNLVGRAVRVWLNFSYLNRIGAAIH
jgi:signal peptidase I